MHKQTGTSIFEGPLRMLAYVGVCSMELLYDFFLIYGQY